MVTRRYHLKLATWTVVRESGGLSPRTLSSPAAVAELGRDFLREHDDDKEHFWAIFLNSQNHYLLHTSCPRVRSRRRWCTRGRCWGPRFGRAPPPWSWSTTIPAGIRLRRERICA